MKRTVFGSVLLAALILMLTPASAYAGAWVQEQDASYNDVWYYFEKDNPVQGQWKKIGNYWYRFREDGVLETNTWTEDGYFVNADGVWLSDWGKIGSRPLQGGVYECTGNDFREQFSIEIYNETDTGDGIGSADAEHYKRGYYGAGGNGTDTWYEMYGTVYDLEAGYENTPPAVHLMISYPDTGNVYYVYPLENGGITVNADGVWRLFHRTGK